VTKSNSFQTRFPQPIKLVSFAG